MEDKHQKYLNSGENYIFLSFFFLNQNEKQSITEGVTSLFRCKIDTCWEQPGRSDKVISATLCSAKLCLEIHGFLS